MTRVVLSWSGGKDCAYALSRLHASDEWTVVELLTTFTAEYERSSMHGVRKSLYEQQAEALGLSLREVMLPREPTNETYDQRMQDEFDRYGTDGVERVAFADLFLEDIRTYREQQLDSTPLSGLWPVWGRETEQLIWEILDAGFRATVVAVDGDALSQSFVGRELDPEFIADLPETVDPCGENGEFHTFVWDGPPFERKLDISVGETITRELGGTTIYYADLTHAT